MEVSKLFHYQTATVHYRVSGSGDPVVLLHGFGEDGGIWDRQVAALSPHCQCIVPDLPGSGSSPFWQIEPEPGIDAYAELIHALLLHEFSGTAPLPKPVMLGHSMGGYICLAFAEKFPGELAKLGLVHSSAYADSEEKKMIRRKAISFMNTNGAAGFLKTSIPGLFRDSSVTGESATDIQHLLTAGNAFTTAALAQYYRAMIARADRTHVLKNFPGPVLFVMGAYDNAVPFQQSLQQCYLPAMAAVHILRNSAHMGLLEETEKLNRILKSFLD